MGYLYRLRVLCLVGLCWMMFGCVRQPIQSTVEPPVLQSASEDRNFYWWYARFRLQWDQQSEPDWSLDVLLADQLVRPALQQYPQQIALWRVHRRAAPDAAGHQFSFIFRSTPDTAAAIFQQLTASPWLPRLQQQQVLMSWYFDNPLQPARADIAATSDPSWPSALQQSWPYYIQGVCQTWLALIANGELPDASAPLSDWFDYYRQRQQAVTQLFQSSGQHGFLHHLNAIFAYQPMLMRF